MFRSFRFLSALAAAFTAIATHAAAFDVSRQTVEAGFPKSTRRVASLLRCM
jgi:hypothetical protein